MVFLFSHGILFEPDLPELFPLPHDFFLHRTRVGVCQAEVFGVEHAEDPNGEQAGVR
jgi:hypothetical protein